MSGPVDTATRHGLWGQLVQVIRWAKVALGVIAVLFVAMLFGQGWTLVRAASDVHPWLGSLVGVGLASLAGVLLGLPIYRYLITPKVATPPETSDVPTHSDLLQIARYLDRSLANAERNPELTATRAQIPLARAEVVRFTRRIRLASSAENAAIDKELAEWAEKTLPAIWKPVEQKVDRLIYAEALNVGLATAISPNGTLDAYLMLWRGTNLISQIATLHYGRPGLLGTLAVCRDVGLATALAGYMQSVTDSIGNMALHSIGGVAGVMAGPVTDGVTNALVLTRIGYLAQARCRSYRQWNPAMQKSALHVAVMSTQKVAIGLATEIVRKCGVGIGAMAGGVASTVAAAAGSAASGVAAAAGSAAVRMSDAAGVVVDKAAGWGTTLRSKLFGNHTFIAK